MATCCSGPVCASSAVSPRFRRALWAALIINAAMFVLELVAGLASGSVALWADALDFGGDAANYAISLVALSMGVMWRARVAMLKGLTMAAFGGVVMARSAVAFHQGVPPEAMTMGLVGTLALLANVVVAVMLFRFREGDANMRSVWLCSRNDAIGNLAVIAAAAGVFGTGSGLPDLIVALGMSALAMWSGLVVVQHARREMLAARSGGTPAIMSRTLADRR